MAKRGGGSAGLQWGALALSIGFPHLQMGLDSPGPGLPTAPSCSSASSGEAVLSSSSASSSIQCQGQASQSLSSVRKVWGWGGAVCLGSQRCKRASSLPLVRPLARQGPPLALVGQAARRGEGSALGHAVRSAEPLPNVRILLWPAWKYLMIRSVTQALVCTYCVSDAGKASGGRAEVTLAELLLSVRHIARCVPKLSPVSPPEGPRGGCPHGQPWDLHNMGGCGKGTGGRWSGLS